MSRHSKKLQPEQTDRETDRDTDRHTHTETQCENITFPHTREVKKALLYILLA